jgi:4-hydroxybenzoate polyprenyltransferase
LNESEAGLGSKTKLAAWLKLARVSNLPTAWSNILMAFWVVNESWSPSADLVLLIFASSCFYVAGMILNDVADVEFDRVERPERPIPCGAINRRRAAVAGFGLLFTGFAFAVAAGPLVGGFGSIENWKPVLVSSFLAMCILAYDFGLKKTLAGPVMMGACRTSNVLLGASTFTPDQPILFGFSANILWIALIIGIYVCGITWFARDETKSEKRGAMVSGTVLIIAALASIQFIPPITQLGSAASHIRLFNFVLTVMIGFRIIRAIRHGQPKYIQSAVVTCLISLILIDAMFMLTATQENILPALVVAFLVVPAHLLGKLSRLT